MKRQAVATTLIAAFTLLTLCGWGLLMAHNDHFMVHMPGCEFGNQLAALIGGISVSAFAAIFILLAFLSVLVTGTSLYQPATFSRLHPYEVFEIWNPLQLAFSDGLIHSKAY